MQAWEERYYDREEAREEGFQLGLEEGREKGLEEGRAEGREEGQKMLEEAKKIFKLYMQGKTEEEIAELCEVSIEKIKSVLE